MKRIWPAVLIVAAGYLIHQPLHLTTPIHELGHVIASFLTGGGRRFIITEPYNQAGTTVMGQISVREWVEKLYVKVFTALVQRKTAHPHTPVVRYSYLTVDFASAPVFR